MALDARRLAAHSRPIPALESYTVQMPLNAINVYRPSMIDQVRWWGTGTAGQDWASRAGRPTIGQFFTLLGGGWKPTPSLGPCPCAAVRAGGRINSHSTGASRCSSVRDASQEWSDPVLTTLVQVETTPQHARIRLLRRKCSTYCNAGGNSSSSPTLVIRTYLIENQPLVMILRDNSTHGRKCCQIA